MCKQHPTDLVTDGIRNPVNRVAARVVMRGQHWTPSCSGNNEIQSRNPLQVIEPPPLREDLRGREFGALRVIGFWANRHWVCRCICGTYVVRRDKAVKNPKNDIDACRECRELRFLKREQVRLSTGRNIDVADVPGVMRRFSGP